MLLTIVFACGMVVGWQRAGRLGGDRLDRLQYGVAHAIALTLLAFAAWLLAARLGWI